MWPALVTRWSHFWMTSVRTNCFLPPLIYVNLIIRQGKIIQISLSLIQEVQGWRQVWEKWWVLEQPGKHARDAFCGMHTHTHVCVHEHEHIQGPRLSTTGEQLGVNLLASVMSNTSSGKGRHTFCTENRDLVPKTWVAWDFQSSTSSSTTGRVGSSAVSGTVGHSTSAPNLGPELISMFSTSGIHWLLQHITENSDCSMCLHPAWET